MIDYPEYVCDWCGRRHGRAPGERAFCTAHIGNCDVCGKETSVTSPRHYGHLGDTWVAAQAECAKRAGKT